MGKKNCFVSLFEEKDFLEASKFIIEEKEHCHDGYLFFPEQYEGKNFPEYYRAINMRTNHFHEAEVYLNVIDKVTKERIGVVGIYICPNNYVVYITTMVLQNKGYLEVALAQLNAQLKAQSVEYVKVKFTDQSANIAHTWQENGFERECVIRAEGIKKSDFWIYSKKL